jgi:hypothetical protein
MGLDVVKPPDSNKAWRVEVNGLTAVFFAETEPKARWQAVKSYRQAGYGRDGE